MKFIKHSIDTLKYRFANQHGFVRKRSVLTNTLCLLKINFEAIDYSVDNEVLAFYTDVSKTLDRVLYYETLKKVSSIGVEGCVLEAPIDYLTEMK